MPKPKEPSYNTLKRDLKCANEEAQGYLDQVVALRKEVDALKRIKEDREAWRRMCSVLLSACEMYQGIFKFKENK